MYKVGDTIKINEPQAAYHGELGTIVQVHPGDAYPYQIKLRIGTFWFPAEELVATPDANIKQPSQEFIDGGLAIGGLGRHVEQSPAPTVEQIKRQDRRQAQTRRCKSCGCSELDGAMFTTAPGSGLCDDCL